MGLRDRLGSLWRRATESELAAAPSAIAADLVDHLAIHRPSSWTQITIECRPRQGGLRVVSYDIVAAGSEPEPAPRYLLDDNGMRTAFVSVTIERLVEALAASDPSCDWTGERLEVRRVGDRFVVNALDEDGNIAAAIGAMRERDRLLPPALIERLHKLHDTIESRERTLDSLLAGVESKAWDRAQSPDRIELHGADGTSRTVRVALLGSHSQERQSFTWAWANPSASRMAAAPSKTLRQNDRTVFGRGAFQSSEPFACTVAHLAALRLGGAAYAWHVGTGDTLFFSLDLP